MSMVLTTKQCFSEIWPHGFHRKGRGLNSILSHLLATAILKKVRALKLNCGTFNDVRYVGGQHILTLW